MAVLRWEYNKASEYSALAVLGAEGWELVSVITSTQGGETFYLKRPSPSIREELTLSQREQVLHQTKEATS